MASRHEVKCINKTDRYNAHERIRAIVGVTTFAGMSAGLGGRSATADTLAAGDGSLLVAS